MERAARLMEGSQPGFVGFIGDTAATYGAYEDVYGGEPYEHDSWEPWEIVGAHSDVFTSRLRSAVRRTDATVTDEPDVSSDDDYEITGMLAELDKLSFAATRGEMDETESEGLTYFQQSRAHDSDSESKSDSKSKSDRESDSDSDSDSDSESNKERKGESKSNKESKSESKSNKESKSKSEGESKSKSADEEDFNILKNTEILRPSAPATETREDSIASYIQNVAMATEHELGELDENLEYE